MSKKICIVTGTRAEYGLLKPLIDILRESPEVDLQLMVTGMHLSPEFGLTVKFIEQDGLVPDKKVDMLLSSDTATGIIKSMGVGMIGYADALADLKPDLLVVLGDRYEIMAVVTAALIHKIPVAHLHGGEITEGAYDDPIRHCITKMSHLHFTATEAYRHRVIQLGEQPGNVYNAGAIGLDNIDRLALLTKAELEEQLDIRFAAFNYLVTFHPATMAHTSAAVQFQALLDAIDEQENSFFIFTKANSDTDGRIINKMIDDYVAQHKHKAVAYTSMGQLRYLSAMQMCDAVVGNSSSGIIEAPSFRKPVINIGDRQKGRIQGAGVINVPASRKEISAAFAAIKDEALVQQIQDAANPYHAGNTAEKIARVLLQTDFTTLIPKAFHDISNV